MWCSQNPASRTIVQLLSLLFYLRRPLPEIVLSFLNLLRLVLRPLEVASQLRQFLLAKGGNFLALPRSGLRQLFVRLLDPLLEVLFRLLEIGLLGNAAAQQHGRQTQTGVPMYLTFQALCIALPTLKMVSYYFSDLTTRCPRRFC